MASLDAAGLVGLLADDDRRLVVAALTLGATGLDTVVAATGLPPERASRALGRLVDAGLVISGSDGTLIVLGAAFQQAARAALSRPPRDEHADEPGERRKVLDAFVVDGRITSIPAARGKRLVVLDWLAQDFEPGVRYDERAGQRDHRAPPRRRRDAAPVPRRRAPARPGRRRVLAHRRHGPLTVAGSHYDTLGVRPDASAREIRDAYRRLARIHHPDHGDADAGSMAALNEAYRVLGEPSRRAVYDAALRGSATSFRPLPTPGTGDPALRRRRHDAGALPLEARHRDGRDRDHDRARRGGAVRAGRAGAARQPARSRVVRRRSKATATPVRSRAVGRTTSSSRC